MRELLPDRVVCVNGVTAYADGQVAIPATSVHIDQFAGLVMGYDGALNAARLLQTTLRLAEIVDLVEEESRLHRIVSEVRASVEFTGWTPDWADAVEVLPDSGLVDTYRLLQSLKWAPREPDPEPEAWFGLPVVWLEAVDAGRMVTVHLRAALLHTRVGIGEVIIANDEPLPVDEIRELVDIVIGEGAHRLAVAALARPDLMAMQRRRHKARVAAMQKVERAQTAKRRFADATSRFEDVALVEQWYDMVVKFAEENPAARYEDYCLSTLCPLVGLTVRVDPDDAVVVARQMREAGIPADAAVLQPSDDALLVLTSALPWRALWDLFAARDDSFVRNVDAVVVH